MYTQYERPSEAKGPLPAIRKDQHDRRQSLAVVPHGYMWKYGYKSKPKSWDTNLVSSIFYYLSLNIRFENNWFTIFLPSSFYSNQIMGRHSNLFSVLAPVFTSSNWRWNQKRGKSFLFRICIWWIHLWLINHFLLALFPPPPYWLVWLFDRGVRLHRIHCAALTFLALSGQSKNASRRGRKFLSNGLHTYNTHRPAARRRDRPINRFATVVDGQMVVGQSGSLAEITFITGVVLVAIYSDRIKVTIVITEGYRFVIKIEAKCRSLDYKQGGS